VTDVPPSTRRPQEPQAEALLRRVIDVIDAARPMPLSSDSRINKDEVLELLNETLERFPEELRAARRLLKEREEFLAKVRSEGDEILELARARAERMVERTEIVRAAEHRARHVVEQAQADARRLRHDAEDYCDRKLASFEVVLNRTLKVVHAGRAKMQGVPISTHESGLLPGPKERAAAEDGSRSREQSPDGEGDEGRFFDQDQG
jgi:cell division septum initiation protein DivIVA